MIRGALTNRKLEWVSVAGYKSIGRDSPIIVNLNGSSVLAGTNSSGKSSTLEAINLLFVFLKDEDKGFLPLDGNVPDKFAVNPSSLLHKNEHDNIEYTLCHRTAHGRYILRIFQFSLRNRETLPFQSLGGGDQLQRLKLTKSQIYEWPKELEVKPASNSDPRWEQVSSLNGPFSASQAQEHIVGDMIAEVQQSEDMDWRYYYQHTPEQARDVFPVGHRIAGRPGIEYYSINETTGDIHEGFNHDIVVENSFAKVFSKILTENIRESIESFFSALEADAGNMFEDEEVEESLSIGPFVYCQEEIFHIGFCDGLITIDALKLFEFIRMESISEILFPDRTVSQYHEDGFAGDNSPLSKVRAYIFFSNTLGATIDLDRLGNELLNHPQWYPDDASDSYDELDCLLDFMQHVKASIMDMRSTVRVYEALYPNESLFNLCRDDSGRKGLDDFHRGHCVDNVSYKSFILFLARSIGTKGIKQGWYKMDDGSYCRFRHPGKAFRLNQPIPSIDPHPTSYNLRFDCLYFSSRKRKIIETGHGSLSEIFNPKVIHESGIRDLRNLSFLRTIGQSIPSWMSDPSENDKRAPLPPGLSMEEIMEKDISVHGNLFYKDYLLIDILNEWLSYLGFNDKLLINADALQSAQSGGFDMFMTMNGHPLQHQGHGIRQILPIITSALNAVLYQPSSHSILLWEQPEIHMNPLAMQRFPEFISRLVKSGSGKVSIIVETHSRELLESYCFKHHSDFKNTDLARSVNPQISLFKMVDGRTVVEDPFVNTETGSISYPFDTLFVDSDMDEERRNLEMSIALVNNPERTSYRHKLEAALMEPTENIHFDFKEGWANKLNDSDLYRAMHASERVANSNITIDKRDKQMFMISKYVASFLNSSGGILFFGVKDAKNTTNDKPKVCGVQNNLGGKEVANWETFTAHLSEVLLDSSKGLLHGVSNQNIDVGVVDYNGKTVIVVNCIASKMDAGVTVRSQTTGEHLYYVRKPGYTKTLTAPEFLHHIRERSHLGIIERNKF